MNEVYDPLRLSAVSLDVLTVGRATSAAITARQRVRLGSLLDATRRDSRLYQQLWQHVSPAQLHTANDPLQLLPVVRRDQLMGHFDDWVTDQRLKFADLLAYTKDARKIARPYLGRYIIWESSGTSGMPGVFVQDLQSMTVYDALEALRRSHPRNMGRWLDPLGLGERIALVTATGGHFASYVSTKRLCEVNPWVARTVETFSIMQPVDQLVEALNAWKPTVIATYPTVAALLAEQSALGRLRVRPREIWTGGETLTLAVRQEVERQLNCTMRNNYGASEFLTMGWECDHGHMHLNSDWVILEPVDDQYRPVPPGEPSACVLLTHLANTVQPLVRYELSDQITIHPERCSCGSPLPVFEIQGRRDEPLVMAGRHGHPVTLLPMALTTVLEDDAGVFDFQLRQQDAHTLVLRLPEGGSEGEAAMARCRHALSTFTEQQGAQPLQLIEELGQPLPRGRSGKVRRVIAAPMPS